MKDQRLLLRKCQVNEIPAIIFQGTDPCAVKILKSAEEIYKKNGCSMEFLYDFNRLTKDFEDYSNENKKNLTNPTLEACTDKQVLNECIYKEIPVIVFQGTDSHALDILLNAKNIYEKNGCTYDFLSGYESFINTFDEYKNSHISVIKTPGLSESEKVFVREDMDFDFLSAVEMNKTDHLKRMIKIGYQPSDETLLAAMRKDPFVLEHFDNLSERVQLAAVNAFSYAIQGIRNPADKVLLTAIHKCPEVFEFIDNPSDTVKMAAVKLKPDNLQYIEEPYKEIVEVAMHLEPDVCKHCDNITEAMYKSVIEPYRTFKSAIEKNEFTKLVELSECGYRPSSELIRLLSGTFSESTSVALQKIFGMEVFASSNIQLRIDLPDSDVMSRQQFNVIEQSVLK